MLAFLPLLLGLLSAQPVRFSGSASISGEYGWVTGDSLVEPRPELRFNLGPSISFWGVPFSLDMNLSTMESGLRQQLNKYRFFLHPQEWVEGMTNLSGFALAIRGIELGSCNPSWSPLTLSGAPVLGGAFELTPWKFYLAGAAGRVQRAVVVSDSTDGAYSRMLYSGKFGFGRKEATHFYLTGMYVTDDSASLRNNMLPTPGDTEPPIDSFEVVRPKEDYVVGMEFNLLAGEVFTLESEAAVSEHTRDNRLPVESWDWMPKWVTNTFKPRLSSSVDFAFAVRPALNVLDTRLSGKLEFVGPGYVSLGAPDLRNDNFVMGAGIERDFLDRSVSVSVGVSAEHDNLLAVKDDSGRVIRLKSTTTRFTSWESNLSLAFPDLPYFSAGYYPYSQRDDSTGMTGNVVSVSAGHGFQTGRLSHSPSATVSYNDVRGDDPEGDYTSWDLGLGHSVGFEFPLSLSAGAGYSRSVSAAAETPDTRLYFDVTPSYTLFDVWSNSLTLGGTFDTGTRVDVRYSSSFPVWKICDASVGVAGVVYNGDDGKYNEFRLNAGLSKNW